MMHNCTSHNANPYKSPRLDLRKFRPRTLQQFKLALNVQPALKKWPTAGLVCGTVLTYKQELSYRKQIARKLCTQFVEGISVTLKSTWRVTQGHWKRNRWTDRTRLTISRVIWCWILSWPWNVGQRSLKVIKISAIRNRGCGFLFAFYSNYGRICSRLWDIQCQRMAWPWKPG